MFLVLCRSQRYRDWRIFKATLKKVFKRQRDTLIVITKRFVVSMQTLFCFNISNVYIVEFCIIFQRYSILIATFGQWLKIPLNLERWNAYTLFNDVIINIQFKLFQMSAWNSSRSSSNNSNDNNKTSSSKCYSTHRIRKFKIISIKIEHLMSVVLFLVCIFTVAEIPNTKKVHCCWNS